MKWLSVTNSYPARKQSKPFFLSDEEHPITRPKQTVSDECLTELPLPQPPPHPFGLYSVTRVNPLYIDDSNALPSSPDPKISLANNSNNDCPEHCCKTDYLHTNPLRDDALTVLKQNSDFIRSIVVSLRLNGCHRQNADLAPIPEGRADCIPRPVWPSDGQQPYTISRHNGDSRRVPKTLKYNKHKQNNIKKYDKAFPTMVYQSSPMAGSGSVATDAAAAAASSKSLPEILRELSASINNAMENADRVEIPAETVLRSLREKINKCLDSCSMADDTDEPQTASFKDNAVATLSRAFSFVNSFSHGSQDELEKGRLLLLKRLGKFPSAADHQPYEQVQRSSSSSSSDTSTSGFSDLTHTPPSSSNASASDSPPVGRTAVDNIGGQPSSANPFEDRENRMLVVSSGAGDKGVLCKNINNHCDNAKNGLSLNSFEYYLVQSQSNFSNVRSFNGSSGGGVSFKGVEQTTDHTKSDTLISSYPGRRCPDFTLDVQQAEMVMKKISERKKERCWCRVITSLVGFAFLLFSVMFFSMMVTRGEKMFGSL